MKDPGGPISYVRILRRQSGLTQRELAFVLGRQGPARVSRLETGQRGPTVPELLIMEMLFSVPAEQLFPRLGRRIRYLIKDRLSALKGFDAQYKRTKDIARSPFTNARFERLLESVRRQQSSERACKQCGK